MHNLNFIVSMRNSFLKISMGLAVLNVAIFSSVAADAGMKTLHGHVVPPVPHLKKESDLAPTTDLKLTIGLPLRNQEAVATLLGQVYDPSSPNYHRFLTPDQFTAQFGPTVDDYQSVIN